MKTSNLAKVLLTLVLLIPTFAQAELQGDVAPTQAVSSCINLRNDLQYRSTGIEVSQLQDFLQSKGYLNSEPTGYFGLLTQAAVKKFQTASGILSSGYVGPITRGKIQSTSCGTTNTSPTSLQSGCRPGDLFSPTTGERCNAAVACTMEVKVCPDGSYVGRVAPSCAFAACPTASGSSLPTPSISFQASPSTVEAQQSSKLSWSVRNAQRCVLQYGSSEETVAVSGTKTVSPSKTTSYKLWCANDNGIGKDGPAAEKTVTVNISTALPSCTLSTNKSSYQFGETVTFNWTSKNATYATFKQYNDGKDHQYVAGDKLDVSGTYSTPTNVYGNPTVTLLIYNHTGSSSCSTTFLVE